LSADVKEDNPPTICLIIAMPKSASSSLTGHFMEHYGLEEMTQNFRDRASGFYVPAGGYAHMSYHNEGLFEVDANVIRELINSSGIVKYHFPPTLNNQAHLKDMKKVILLRDPEDVVRAWMRGDETRAYKLRSPEFAYTYSEAAWMKRAERLGLVGELEAFGRGWREHEGDRLVVETKDLIGDPQEVLARIEDYLGLEPSGARALPERKFSRGAASRRPLWNTRVRQFVRRRNVMGRRVAIDLKGLFEKLLSVFGGRSR
jgi:hypothetical protein